MKQEKVKLTPVDSKDGKPKEFGIDQANKILSLNNTKWKLSDEKFTWNGKEIAKK